MSIECRQSSTVSNEFKVVGLTTVFSMFTFRLTITKLLPPACSHVGNFVNRFLFGKLSEIYSRWFHDGEAHRNRSSVGRTVLLVIIFLSTENVINSFDGSNVVSVMPTRGNLRRGIILTT